VVTNVTTSTAPVAGSTSTLATTTTGFGPAGDPGPANPFPILSNFPAFIPGTFFVVRV
jgi:hypothetical protein